MSVQKTRKRKLYKLASHGKGYIYAPSKVLQIKKEFYDLKKIKNQNPLLFCLTAYGACKEVALGSPFVWPEEFKNKETN